MSRKRSLLTQVCRKKKRICMSAPPTETDPDWDDSGISVDSMPSDTKSALLYLRNLFPCDKFEGRIPPIILQHQLYSVIKNRTDADKELEDLRSSGEIRLFKLSSGSEVVCAVFKQDYLDHVRLHSSTADKTVLDKFISIIASDRLDISISRDTMLHSLQFSDEDITELIKASVLTVRDVGSWWLAIPNAGVFMKSYLRGRKAVITMISKSKYREILQKELETRKLPKIARLGMMYHLHDIIGSDVITCVPTTSGPLLRLTEKY